MADRITARLAFITVLMFLCAGAYIRAQQTPQKPQTPVFRVGVETVFLKVSVSDPLNRYVTGLEKEHFKVFEDKVEQNIAYFTTEAPGQPPRLAFRSCKALWI